MTHFLITGLPPDHLPLDARKRLAVRSRNFCLVTDTLYHKGLDGLWRRCRENPLVSADREAEPPGFWTRRV